MAENKTFRYGLIVLGFFLVMIGMFIMSVEKPQIYITFCTLGVLTILTGVVWSMCQCYPKVQIVSAYSESEKFLIKKPGVSCMKNEIPEKSSSQTPYTSLKESEVYEKSLPSYEQVQKTVAGSEEHLGVLPAPVPQIRTGADVQPLVQAKAEVHRNSENDRDKYKYPESQKGATTLHSQSKMSKSQAPLASLQEEMDTSSMESASNSPFLQRWKSAPNTVFPTESQLRYQLPCYEDFALIDSVTTEGQGWNNGEVVAPNPSHFSARSTEGDGISTKAAPGLLEQRVMQKGAEDDMYYGIKEGPEDVLISVGGALERKETKN
ncbi:barttin [Anolis sagrei]|uniref:barttin n=1 Tax=Anolis sagrei TaxID=38937 RepID=UPI003522039B